jgi:hypothetical protein
MLFQGGFTFANLITDAFAIFMFILWFWLLIVVSGDLFRRHDVSGSISEQEYVRMRAKLVG